MKQPRILSERLLFESRKFRLYEQEVLFPNGHREVWEFITPKWKAGVQLLPVTEREELILIREFRGAARRSVLRLPTGALEAGESPEEAARREIEEEVGFSPKRLELIEERHSTSSYFRGKLYVFYATDLTPCPVKREPGEQTMELVFLPLERAFSMAENLEIEGEGTVYSILRLRKYLRS